MTDSPVLFDTLPTACGRRFGIATLNAPAVLNALSLPMVRLLTPQLRAWAADGQTAGVLLQASGDKAFCAGGDLRQIYPTLRTQGAARNPQAERFFAEEYALDYLIHSFPKPLLCWGHGIVMGGGMGLMAGASHRVVTEASRIAMPEVSIGLYPDVGGSWFLRRAPGRTGLFMALTAASLNASDALFAGLADVCVPQSCKAQVLQAIGAADWSGSPQTNRARLSRILAAASAGAQLPPALLRQHYDRIGELMAGDDLGDIAQRLSQLRSDDAWLHTAARTFAHGAPSSIALIWELWQRVTRLSLAQVFQLEYCASLGCCAHSDFAEGVRALLIDKDRQPRWQPATLQEVSPQLVQQILTPRELPPELAVLDQGG